MLNYSFLESPVGLLKLVATDQKLLAILWDNEPLNRVKLGEMVEEQQNHLLSETKKQLNDYFLGQRKTFNLPLEIGGTTFQRSVWELLNQIPYGVTWAYKDIAVKLARPLASRAVGTAIGRNPLSIIIPCHRVIASNGSLAGFAGGLERKQILLDLEQQAAAKT